MLKDHYKCDFSTLIKKSLYEIFEDLQDKKIINDFEKRENSDQTEFMTFDNIMQ